MTTGRRIREAIFCVMLCAGAMGAASWSSASDPVAPPSGGMEGEALYNASCIVCHGPQAKGAIGPRLAGNPVLSDDRAFQKILTEGRHMMPPLKDTLTAEQLAAIRAWLRTLK